MRSNKKQFLLFIISGGISAFINIFSRAILSIFFEFKISIIFAYCIGMITAYVLSRKFVFISQHNLTKSFLAFTIINLIAIVQTYFISIWVKEIVLPFFGIKFLIELISHSIGVAFPVFTSFVGHKYISFGKITK